MDIYIDIVNKRAITSAVDPTPAVRPDIRTPTTYPVRLYFTRATSGYVRYQFAVIVLNVRTDAPVDAAQFSLAFRGVETAPISASASTDQIAAALSALPSVGKGNVKVVGSKQGGWIVEFVGELTAIDVPTMTARVVSSSPAAEINISTLPTDSNHLNERQVITLRRAPLAKVTTWTETGVPSTPGWSGTLDMSAVPLSTWDNPTGNIMLEVVLTPVNARSGSDGVTVSDGVGRGSFDGVIIPSTGVANQTANCADNGTDSFLIANDGNGSYGRKFVLGDVGRIASDTNGYVFPGTTIVEVVDDGVINAARLSQRLHPNPINLQLGITYSLADQPSDVFQSAVANWTAADVGHVLNATNVPAGTRIAAVINAQYVRLSQRATALGSGLTWVLLSDTTNVFQTPTGAFMVNDVGSRLRAPTVLPNDATITQWIDAQHVMLSVRPTAVATAIQWQLIPARPYPTPTVTVMTSGDALTQAKQKIALAQPPSGGSLVIQDGYGSAMPQLTLPFPVSGSDIQNALNNTYLNYGVCVVDEIVPGAEWNVTWGKAGAQRTLAVLDTQAVYDQTLLNWNIADGTALPTAQGNGRQIELPDSLHVLTWNGLKYINVNALTDSWVVGRPRFTRMTDGTKAIVARQKYMAFTDYMTVFALGRNQGPMGNQAGPFYFTGFEGGEERYGLYIVDLVFATMPASRVEILQQQRTCIGVNVIASGTLVKDIQFWTVSASTFVEVHITYGLDLGLSTTHPNDGPFGVAIHFATFQGIEYAPIAEIGGGFEYFPPGSPPPHQHGGGRGTFGQKFTQSWSRRIWMGNIWEQRLNYN